MTEFKGTKGPWVVKHSESKDAFNVIGTVLGGKYKIARCQYLFTDGLTDFNKREKAEANADAQLIATAPELLATLQKAMDDILENGLDQYVNTPEIMRVINKALNK